MELGLLLTRSHLTHPQVSSMVSPSSFYLLVCRFILLSAICCEALWLYDASIFFCIPLFCPKLGSYIVCVCLYTHTHTYIYIYIYIHTYTYVHTYYMWLQFWTIYVCVYVYIYLNIYIYIHMYVHICVCIYSECMYNVLSIMVVMLERTCTNNWETRILQNKGPVIYWDIKKIKL